MTSRIVSGQISREMNSDEIKNRFGITLGTINNLRYFSDWKRALSKLNSENDALWVLVPYDVRDANNQEVPVDKIGISLTKLLKIPTMGIISVHTKIGLLGAINVNPEGLGRQAAEQAYRLFKGERLESIGIEKTRYYKMEINGGEAKRLGLKIPPELKSVTETVGTEELKYGR